MAIYDLLPKFGYIEANNLKALQPGFVVAQMPVAESAFALTYKTAGVAATKASEMNYMENGTICTISKDGIIAPAAATDTLFICYNDPLLTLKNNDEFYAVDLAAEDPRLVQLIPGDEWMATRELDLSGVLEGRIVEVKSTDGMGKSDDWFSQSTMANGDAAHHYMFLR